MKTPAMSEGVRRQIDKLREQLKMEKAGIRDYKKACEVKDEVISKLKGEVSYYQTSDVQLSDRIKMLVEHEKTVEKHHREVKSILNKRISMLEVDLTLQRQRFRMIQLAMEFGNLPLTVPDEDAENGRIAGGEELAKRAFDLRKTSYFDDRDQDEKKVQD